MKKTESVVVPAILAGIFLLLVILSFLSEGYPFGAENPTHYYFARYSWQNPDFFLNLWARPLFTMVMSPAAQFGMIGIRIMNSLFAVLTAWFAFLTMRRLEIRPPWLVIILLIFTPLYFYVIMSSLTEVFFCFIFMLSVFLFFRERYLLSALAASFLMFARLEGFLFFPLFTIAFMVKRKYLAIPFLAAGFLVFSVIGSFFTRDLLWIINRFPYSRDHGLYDAYSGPLYHYIEQYDSFLGIPLTVLFIAGLVYLIFRLFSGEAAGRWHALCIILLVPAPFIMYLAFHSYLFWTGQGGSLGSLRHMSTILPMASVTAMFGFYGLTKWLYDRKWIRISFIILVIGSVIVVNFITYPYPIPLGKEEQMVKKACDWWKKSPYKESKIYFTSPDAILLTGINPFDPEEGGFIKSAGSLKWIPNDAVILWEAHFGSNECGIPLDTIMQYPGLKLVAWFEPEQLSFTFGGIPYSVMLFEKGDTNESFNNYERIEPFIRSEEKNLPVLFSRILDFEPSGTGMDPNDPDRISAHSGSGMVRIQADREFGPGIFLRLDSLADSDDLLFRSTVYIYPTEDFSTNPASLVLTIDRNMESVEYNQVQLDKVNWIKPGRWNKVTLRLYPTRKLKRTDDLKTYIYQRGKSTFYYDDLELEIFRQKNGVRRR